MPSDRKTLIADTAIALLASMGSRGLTHRAVDAEAGLPAGSTSAYCRSRAELIALALARHAALDLADLEDDARSWARRGLSQDLFVDTLSRRIEDWLSPAKRQQLVARFELFLIASREPELAAVIGEQRRRFVQAAADALRAAGVERPDAVAPGLVMTVDGMLLDQVSGLNPPLDTAQRKAVLRRALRTDGEG